MFPSFPLRTAGATLALAGVLLLSACAMPLAPGYTVEQQQFEVRYVPGAPAHLRVRASYALRNTGNRDLSFIDTALPGGQALGRQNLRVSLEGREVSVQPASGAGDQLVRIPFDPPWPLKQRRSLLVEYDLAPTPPGSSLLAVNDSSFHIRDADGFPALRPPKGFLAKGGRRPKEIRLVVQVPDDFRVFAAGRELRSHRQDNAIEHRFRIPREDFEPFVVAGRYQEQRITASGGMVLFWTLQPLPAQQAQVAGARLARTFETFRAAFGPLGKSDSSVRVIEAPARLGERFFRAAEAAGAAAPRVALLDRQAFGLGVSSDAFLDLAEHQLAHTWFGLLIAPRPEAALVLGEGLCEYAVVVAAEARNGDAERRRRVAVLLRQYDETRAQAGERPLLALASDFTPPLRDVAAFKAALFYLALEDQYGKEKVRRALADLVSSLRFRQAADAELRAVLEQETKQDLFDFFRIWLNQKDIPADFRVRYKD